MVYIIFAKTKALQKNIDWSNVQEEDIHTFVPPITYGKVLKVYTGDMITIASQIPFFDESTINSAPIYRFMIYLDGISAPKPITLMNIQNDIGKLAKEELTKKIEGEVVELRGIKPDKHGRIYATVFLGEINVNAWLLEKKYVTSCKNGRKRRASESDSDPNFHHRSNKTQKLPNISPSFIDPGFGIATMNTSPLVEPSTSSKKNNYILPQIELPRQNTDGSDISSTVQTDCFLSHNWGENHKNHDFVKKVNAALKTRGLKTWLDENRIDGSIRFKMAEGIDNTKCVVVFITKEYREKVNGVDMKDNCKYEFSYAMNQLGSQNMVPVILEPEMRDTRKWKGELGAALGSMLYVDLSDTYNLSETEYEKKMDEVFKRVKMVLDREKKKKNS